MPSSRATARDARLDTWGDNGAKPVRDDVTLRDGKKGGAASGLCEQVAGHFLGMGER